MCVNVAGFSGSYLQYCYFHIIMAFSSFVSLHKILILSSRFGSRFSSHLVDALVPIHPLKLRFNMVILSCALDVSSEWREGKPHCCTKIGPQKYMPRFLDICPDDEHLQRRVLGQDLRTDSRIPCLKENSLTGKTLGREDKTNSFV